MAYNYKQGKYSLINRDKYKGDPTQVIYRSSWEKRVFEALDNSPHCIQWSSEEVVIPYISPLDNKPHRYFVDIFAVFKYPDNSRKTFLFEIKPLAQTFLREQKRQSKKLLEEAMTFAVNKAKWEAAEKYAKQKGWHFKIITEKDLNI